MYKLTEKGKKKVNAYIQELKAKRKEILDARLDTADDTTLPTVEDIISDIEFEGVDNDGDYYNSWGVTDNNDADEAIGLKIGEDFIPDEPYLEISDIDWDSDGECVNAPQVIFALVSDVYEDSEEVTAENYGMHDDEIADYLSDEYEYCVNSFVAKYKG